MKRIRFYRWLRFEVFKQDPHTYPASNSIFHVIRAILFPLDFLYERQSRVHYYPPTNRYTLEGQKIDGHVLYWMNRMPEGAEITLKKNEDGIWQVSKA
jgi:hypothetical protein